MTADAARHSTTASVDAQWSLDYRPGLDGLRGLAVALVLWNHGGFPMVEAAGAVGVNIFFALSGFLITRLALEERERTGQMSLRRFYWRRSLRLFPAMYAVLAVTTLVAFLTDRSLQPIVLAAVYVVNIFKAAGMDTHLVTHTWTLAMEEQFYLVWPGMLLLALRCNHRRRAVAVVLLGISVSLTVRVAAALSGAGMIYLHNSAALATGVLLAGCWLALIAERATSSRYVNTATFTAAFAAIAVVSVGAKTTGLYLLGIPAVTIASLFAIVYLVRDQQSRWIHSVATWKPLRSLGKISYGLYLWHFVVFWLVRQNVDLHPYVRWLLQVGASLIVATLSYRFLELPFLRLKERFSANGEPVSTSSR